MKFTKIRAPDFNLAMTLDSGQVFHWQRAGDGFAGAIGDLPGYLEQRAGTLRVLVEGGARERPSERRGKRLDSQKLAPPVQDLVARYFALDHWLVEICDSFPNDPVMNAARDFCHGLRIIRQPK